MKFQIPKPILARTGIEELSWSRDLISRHVDMNDLDATYGVEIDRLSDEAISDICSVAEAMKANKFLRSLRVVIDLKDGSMNFKVPSFEAFGPMLVEYLRAYQRDGWVYEMTGSGDVLPWAITSVRRIDNSARGDGNPRIEMSGVAFGPADGVLRTRRRTWFFDPKDVSRRHIAKILQSAGILTETAELRAAHNDLDARFREVLRDGFSRQYRITGAVAFFDGPGASRRDPLEARGCRAIMDIDDRRVRGSEAEIETQVFDNGADTGFIEIPSHPVLEFYNLSTHEPVWVSVGNVEPYRYHPELREKLVLPEVQRDLLDVITSDTDVLTGDLVEGKSAGNVILTKGVPGVGKTLTAEIYAEVCEKPLYAVHAGNLGTTPKDVSENLRNVFQRAKRWNCVLLLDEADVFVMTRGRDVTQNAIVAEFLRTMEYFDGLLFMTSNRGDDIDEAILSRCAAIIHYEAPGPADAARVWRVMADNFGVALSDDLITGLVAAFPGIAPRDVKMLLRLTIRVAQSRGVEPDLDLFRQCAMFRWLNASRDRSMTAST